MTPSKVKEQTVQASLEALANSETAKQFGFVFVTDEKDVPPPPRKKETDTERWNAVKAVLVENPVTHGTWVKIKDCDKAGTAPSMASRINSDYVKTFPKAEGWEARSKVTRSKSENDPGASELYIRYVPPVAESN